MKACSHLIEIYLEAYRRGDAPAPEVYARQHPACEEELYKTLLALIAMEDLGKTRKQQYSDQNSVRSIPASLGEFCIQERIGAGGMGTVYKALQSSLNRFVAIKILAPVWAIDDELICRFEQESHMIARLHHPNIVQIFGAGHEQDFHFYVMELIDGKEVTQERVQSCVRAESLSRAVAKIGLQAAQALAYAHACKILHRDIKPSNLLLDHEGMIHVSDFGLATVLDENGQALLASRTHFGSLPYMAPECLSGQPARYASDQYSLGLTLYDLMAGQTSFGHGTPATVLTHIANQHFAPLKEIDQDFKQILLKSMRYDPEDRYASMEDMAEDVKRYLSHVPVRARPVSLSHRLGLWIRRHPAITGLSALIAFLLIAWIISLMVGYQRLEKALERAEQNAQIADHALRTTFHYSSELAGTQNTKLLLNLLPYYEMLTSQQGLTKETIADANRILGRIALRGGKYPLAESSFRCALATSKLASDRNLLAECLHAQNKNEEARHIWRELSEGHDIEAVKALRALAGPLRPMPGQEEVIFQGEGSKELEAAIEIVIDLLRLDPHDPECRFECASILSERPELAKKMKVLGQGDPALDLLQGLVAEYPQYPAYRLLLLRLAAKTNLRHEKFAENQSRMRIALQQADELFARWPNEPGVIATGIDVRQKYAIALIQQNRKEEAVRLFERTIGLLENLMHHPDCPPEACEKLIGFKLRFASVLNQMGKIKECRLLLNEIDQQLIQYTGKHKKDFADQRATINADQVK